MQSYNMFNILNSDEILNFDNIKIIKKNKNLLPPINEIIWGVGFGSMIGVSWADECDA